MPPVSFERLMCRIRARGAWQVYRMIHGWTFDVSCISRSRRRCSSGLCLVCSAGRPLRASMALVSLATPPGCGLGRVCRSHRSHLSVDPSRELAPPPSGRLDVRGRLHRALSGSCPLSPWPHARDSTGSRGAPGRRQRRDLHDGLAPLEAVVAGFSRSRGVRSV